MMKFNFLITSILILLLSIFSCQEKKQQIEELTNHKKSNANFLKSKYDSLPEYKWLNDFNNYKDENYQTKYNQFFEQNLKENKFENAAAYLIAYGNTVAKTQKYDSIYALRTIDFYEKYGTKISAEAKSNLTYLVGEQYNNAIQFDKSILWYKKGLEFNSESEKHKQIIGLSYLRLGRIFLEQRDLSNSEKQLIAGLRIFEEIGDIGNQGKVYLLMHMLYLRNDMNDKAELILEKAKKAFEKENDNYNTFTGHIFSVHYHLEHYDTIKGLQAIDEMVNFSKKYTDIADYHKSFLNQFLTYKFIAKNNEDSATYYLNKVKEITERSGIPDLKMRTLYWSISYSNKFNKPLEDPKLTEELFEAMAEAEEPSYQQMVQLAYALYPYYKKIGNYEKANFYNEFLMNEAYRQSNERTKKQLFELETKYETEKKEKTILLQEKKLASQYKMIFSLAAISVFIILISIILFVWNKNKNIIKQKELSENFSSQLLKKTEDERKRIASDLHDSVSNELVNLRHTIENKDNQLKGKIDFILDEVRNISRNISPVLFDKIGLKASVEQLAERIQNQHNFFISSEIDYNGELENYKELQLYRIIQEAITNILKHADAIAGKITITENEELVHVEIKDNGKGFDVNKMLEKGNCFGLLNITERTKFLNGTVDFQSNTEGTIINISIPK